MIERDMEDLIAAYPGDFFSRNHLVLIGRQRSFAGVGRFDLVFEDEFKSTVLMELKARTLKYDDATQVAKYRDELKRNGCKNVVMWLVAPQIPNSVREFLDDKGIEYSEIHLSEFRRVAERRGCVIKSEAEPQEKVGLPVSIGDRAGVSRATLRTGGHQFFSSAIVPTGPLVTSRPLWRWRAIGYDLVLENPESFDRRMFLGLVDTFASVVRSGKNKSLVIQLKMWAENPRNARLASAHD